MKEILEGERVGVALTGFSDAERRSAVDRLFDLVADPSTSARCVETANRLFSLSSGVHAYDGIYQRLSCASASVQEAVQ
jgi:hypothetical protein